jgi:hypothetical protein
VREACSEVHSLANWRSGFAYTCYEGREKVKKELDLSADYDRIEKRWSSYALKSEAFSPIF